MRPEESGGEPPLRADAGRGRALPSVTTPPNLQGSQERMHDLAMSAGLSGDSRGNSRHDHTSGRLVTPQVVALESIVEQTIPMDNGDSITIVRLPQKVANALVFNDDVAVLLAREGAAPPALPETVGLLTQETGRAAAKSALLRRAGIMCDLWEISEIPLIYLKPLPGAENEQGVENTHERGADTTAALQRQGIILFYECSQRKSVFLIPDALEGLPHQPPLLGGGNFLQSLSSIAAEVHRSESALDAEIHICQRFRDELIDACHTSLLRRCGTSSGFVASQSSVWRTTSSGTT